MDIKVKRLFTINTMHGSATEEYTFPKVEETPYIVDDSHFCPMSEAVKQLANSRPLTDEEISACYDFTNGMDNGMQIPITRLAGIADITEMTGNITAQTREIAEKLQKARDKKAYQDQLNSIVNTTANNSVNKIE